MKHSVTASNVAKTSDLSNLAGSRGGLVGLRQPQNNVALFKNHNTGQKLVNEVSYDGKQRNAQDGCNVLHKGLIGASQSSFPSVVNNQIMGFHSSGCSTVPKFIDTRGHIMVVIRFLLALIQTQKVDDHSFPTKICRTQNPTIMILMLADFTI